MTINHTVDLGSAMRLALAAAVSGWALLSYARLLFGPFARGRDTSKERPS